ncbi:hypothetical protein [Paraburkholderia caballeronis]|uniref:hypothetical protein n=1 Tax=Paraburkholderia caballeronis TaxID=416943 RepID=UPI0010652609|nr:hypothetical protein [Paraburkholderia caballeronis]
MSLSEGNTLSLGKSDAGGIERRRTARRACGPVRGAVDCRLPAIRRAAGRARRAQWREKPARSPDEPVWSGFARITFFRDSAVTIATIGKQRHKTPTCASTREHGKQRNTAKYSEIQRK